MQTQRQRKQSTLALLHYLAVSRLSPHRMPFVAGHPVASEGAALGVEEKAIFTDSLNRGSGL